MSRVMSRQAYMALLLAVSALAVAGCGGNDDDSASETSAAHGVSGQQDTAGPQTGATGRTRSGDARPKRAGKPKQGSGKESGTNRSNTGSAPSNTGSAAPTRPTGRKKPAKKEFSDRELKRQVGPAVAKQAHEFCKSLAQYYTLEKLAESYGIKSGKADDVAKAYAAGYPVAIQQQVAAGCKAGLLESEQ